MTTEERFERIEHFTATLAEERRKDREEYKAVWRDTQRQLNELSNTVLDMAEELREADRRPGGRIEQFASESRAADQALSERIASVNQALSERISSLVSAVGDFLGRQQN